MSKKKEPKLEGYQIDLFTKKETPVFFEYRNCKKCNKMVSIRAYKENKGLCHLCLKKGF